LDLSDPRRAVLTTAALVLGSLYLAAGAVGFAITGLEGFADADRGAYLLAFEINPLQNAVHVLTGVGLLAGALQNAAAARAALILVGGVYLIVGLIGFPLLESELNLLSLNRADNWLHIGTAAVTFVVVVVAAVLGRIRRR
jgi:hypothetical protein